MTNYMALFKNNQKAQQKLEKEKEKLEEFCRMVRPHIETNINEALLKGNPQYLLKALEKWFFFLSEAEIIDNTIELQDKVIINVIKYL